MGTTVLNDETRGENDQEIAAAYTKIRKLFNGYGIFSKMYLKECKKFSKVEKRISKTNERLVGAIGKFQQWQIKMADKAIREAEQTKPEKKAREKREKKAAKEEKKKTKPPPPEEDTFFGANTETVAE